jgi:hypothetical protein
MLDTGLFNRKIEGWVELSETNKKEGFIHLLFSAKTLGKDGNP